MSNVLGAIERFFLDIIGTVIPGMMLLIGVWVLIGSPDEILGRSDLLPFADSSNLVFFVVISYVSGYAVTSVAENITLPIIETMIRRFRKYALTRWMVPREVKSADTIYSDIMSGRSYIAFVELAQELFPELNPLKSNRAAETDTKPASTDAEDAASPELIDRNKPRGDLHSWRNVALTMTQKDNAIVYRFMFISLLNLGVATSLHMVSFVWVVLAFLQNLDPSIEVTPLTAWILLLLIVSLPFIERRYAFYRRSLAVPFSMAVVELVMKYCNDKIENRG